MNKQGPLFIKAAVLLITALYALTACRSPKPDEQNQTDITETEPPVIADTDKPADFSVSPPVTDKSAVTDEPFIDDMPVVAREYGNTAGNVMNGGYAAVKGDWVYYRDDNDSYLYKMNTITGAEIRLDSGISFEPCINVVGDAVYYMKSDPENGYGYHAVYKIGTDGFGRTKIADIDGYSTGLCVIGDTIFYYNGGGIYKIRADGSGNEKIIDIGEHNYGFCVEDNWVYFKNDYSGGVYKIRIDGKGLQKITDDASFFNVFENRIYYVNNEDSKIYKINVDGTDKTGISDDIAYRLNVSDGRIYYSYYESGGIVSINLDGTDRTVIGNSDSGSDINLAGDWIFYRYGEYLSPLYKMKKDGSEKTNGNYYNKRYGDWGCARVDGEWIYFIGSDGVYRIKSDNTGKTLVTGTDFRPLDMKIADNWLYYGGYYSVFKVKTDGTGKTQLTGTDEYFYDDGADFIEVVGDWVFCVTNTLHDATCYAVRADGSEKLSITYGGASSIAADGEWVYFTRNDWRGDSAYKTRIVGGEAEVVEMEGDMSYLKEAADGWFYYSNFEDDDKLYKIRADGSGKTKLSDDKSCYITAYGEWVYYRCWNENDALYKIRTDGTERTLITAYS